MTRKEVNQGAHQVEPFSKTKCLTADRQKLAITRDKFPLHQ